MITTGGLLYALLGFLNSVEGILYVPAPGTSSVFMPAQHSHWQTVDKPSEKGYAAVGHEAHCCILKLSVVVLQYCIADNRSDAVLLHMS
jgi:hypothetical protein